MGRKQEQPVWNCNLSICLKVVFVGHGNVIKNNMSDDEFLSDHSCGHSENHGHSQQVTNLSVVCGHSDQPTLNS